MGRNILRSGYLPESVLGIKAGIMCMSLLSGAGNMWAQSWNALEELVRPAPDHGGVDVTNEMVAQVN